MDVHVCPNMNLARTITVADVQFDSRTYIGSPSDPLPSLVGGPPSLTPSTSPFKPKPHSHHPLSLMRSQLSTLLNPQSHTVGDTPDEPYYLTYSPIRPPQPAPNPLTTPPQLIQVSTLSDPTNTDDRPPTGNSQHGTEVQTHEMVTMENEKWRTDMLTEINKMETPQSLI
eukprot:1194467-Prorocentrum_minimum.AAC.4